MGHRHVGETWVYFSQLLLKASNALYVLFFPNLEENLGSWLLQAVPPSLRWMLPVASRDTKLCSFNKCFLSRVPSRSLWPIPVFNSCQILKSGPHNDLQVSFWRFMFISSDSYWLEVGNWHSPTFPLKSMLSNTSPQWLPLNLYWPRNIQKTFYILAYLIIIFSNCFIISSTWSPALPPTPKNISSHSSPFLSRNPPLFPKNISIFSAPRSERLHKHKMFNLRSVCGKERFVSFQSKVKLNLESHIAILLVLEVPEITGCTAEATCLMMVAFCSTGCFCSSFIFVPFQRRSGSVY